MKYSACFFIGDLYPGGAERQLVHICNGLCREGWDVTLITLKHGDAFINDLDPRIKRIALSTKNPVVILYKLALFLRHHKPSVIVNFLFHATLLGRVSAMFSGVPCISSYRNVSCGSARRDAFMRFTAWMDASTLSNVSEARSQLYSARRGRKLTVIPNIYLGSHSFSRDAPVEEKNKKVSSFHWCFLGRLQPQKNISSLLFAFKILLCRYPESMHLSIAGDGQEAIYLKGQIVELGLSSHVSMLGHIPEPEKLLKEADALVLPSLWEGMPNVLMEAMAVGTPCVATPVGAVPEMLGGGARGVLSEGTTADAIAGAMGRLMEMQPAERLVMLDSARSHIIQKCNVETVIGQWNECLCRAASAQQEKK